MKLVVLSDIHANLTAFKAVLEDIKSRNLHSYKIIILGDSINYGLRPNETLDLIKQLNVEVLLAGNHEIALLDGLDNKFSSARGKEVLNLTRSIISKDNFEYIDGFFSKEFVEKEINSKKYLFIHGSIDNKYWGTINSSNINSSLYKKYDVVLSGHSHKPHYIETFFDDDNNHKMRNKKRTLFINPGSVGQPRNHSKESQYCIFDTNSFEITFCKCEYDIAKEQNIYSDYNIDNFYKKRIGDGV